MVGGKSIKRNEFAADDHSSSDPADRGRRSRFRTERAPTRS